MKKSFAEALVGNWFIDGIHFDEGGILVITLEGRVVQFPTSRRKPRMNETMRLWMSEDMGSCVRFRPSPVAEGWLRGVEISGACWTMIATKGGTEDRFLCRHAAREFLPPWFDELLEKNLSVMDALEAQQGAEEGALRHS